MAVAPLSFTSILNAHIERTRFVREGPQPAWYASSLGGCDRKAVLRRAGVKGTPFDIRALRKFYMGDRVHDALKEAVEGEMLKQNLPGLRFLGHEVAVRDDEFHVAGRVDSYVEVGGLIEAWEYKSIASGAFKYGDLPQPYHVLQLGVYLTFPARCPAPHHKAAVVPPPGVQLAPCGVCKGPRFDKVSPLIAQRGRLIYWSKDDALMDEYIIEATPELKSNVKETLRRLEAHYQQYIADKTLPPVLELVQARKRDKKSGEYVPFFYAKDYRKDGTVIPKGTAKMVFDHRCISEHGTNACEYYANACPLTSWPETVTTGPKQGQEDTEE